MSNATYLNVFMVEEFETSGGETARNWTKVGVAFPHSEDAGFNLEIKAFPRDGKLIALPPNAAERNPGERRESEGKASSGAGDAGRSRAPAGRERRR